MKKTILLYCTLSIFINFSFAGDRDVWFQPNKGQWDSRILYKVGLTKGNFFIEKDKFTYSLSDLNEVYHEAHHGNNAIQSIRHHTIQSKFINSSWQGEVIESDSSSFYKNYFIGSNKNNWHGKVRSYKKLKFIDYYPGINLLLEAFPDRIKYSFEVAPGIDPSVIKIFHEGMDKLETTENQVEIRTIFGSIFENELKVWSENENFEKTPVEAIFKASGDTVFFRFPSGYNNSQTLIIDPSLTFSTFTGSTADNWGFTAAPDDQGNLYAGGIVFGTGYPTTVGSYDLVFNGGDGNFQIDMAISKFSHDGTNLLYSTYLGGSGNETPNSIITNSQNELYILGISSSNNFPVSPNAYQQVNHGGTNTNQIAIDFNGTDITISKLSSDGSSLLASTYLGGSKNDGLNISNLNYNYGDVFRGEIILDKNGDVVIASSTQSNDFPTVNVSGSTLGGNQDAIVAKLNPGLSNVIWSTYLGGSNDDSGYSVQVSSSNNLLITGGTKSTDMPSPFSSGYQSSFQGGYCDGFIAKIDGATANITNGTYIGTNQYDQSFFVQLDLSDRVYVFGQTNGNLTISPGVYTNPNSGQFIQQYSPDLSTLNWSTIVGGGNGVVEISPTAFSVSNCNEIYFAGWGGQVNQSIQATGSTSNGFPVTPDAYQSVTNGHNFYIGVLSEDALALNYGTFMGGVNSSYNHVDGGTSRFDKHGNIYHAVCAACGGNSTGFTTTQSAFSTTNNSSNCNMAAWKFELGEIKSSISSPDVFVCLPDSVHFSNNSQNGNSFHWDFGDGSTSNEFEPTHFYNSTGTYQVMLIVRDIKNCFQADTAYLNIEISDFSGLIVQPPDLICPGEPFQLEASGGSSYQWTPAIFLDDPTSATPIATTNSTTTFTVIITDSCGADTLSVVLNVADVKINVSDDISICTGDTVQIWAVGGETYEWSSPDSGAIIDSVNQSSIFVAPGSTTNFDVLITTEDNCEITRTINVLVYQDVPQPILDDTSFVCKNSSVQVTASGAPDIFWSPAIDINTITGSSVVISTNESRWYYVDFVNPCGAVKDSIYIEVVSTFNDAGSDTTICPQTTAELWATGGISYEWFPKETVVSPYSDLTTVTPSEATTYTVLITDGYGCTDTISLHVDFHPEASVKAVNDYYGFSGDQVPLSAEGSTEDGIYTWSPKVNLSCEVCKETIASPGKSTTYTVTFEDENGCLATDAVKIIYEALFYVPNTFTPDEDEFNEVFNIVGGNILSFEMKIFNRWGELIFQTRDMEFGWDGTYGGMKCPDGTYIWQIIYTDIEYNKKEIVGHVNLLR